MATTTLRKRSSSRKSEDASSLSPPREMSRADICNVEPVSAGELLEQLDTFETRTERAGRLLGNWHPVGAVPTPEEIAEACRMLREAALDTQWKLTEGGAI